LDNVEVVFGLGFYGVMMALVVALTGISLRLRAIDLTLKSILKVLERRR